MMQSIASGALVITGLTAVWFDVKERRIPNTLTVGAFAVAMAARIPGGLPDLGSGLLGALICFALALPFFLVGGLGGGDVKLLTAFGAFLGPSKLAPALFVMAVVGGGLAFVAMVHRKAVGRTLWNLYLMMRTFGRKTFTGWKGEESEAWMTLATPGAISVPYGVAISAGALYAWFLS